MYNISVEKDDKNVMHIKLYFFMMGIEFIIIRIGYLKCSRQEYEI